MEEITYKDLKESLQDRRVEWAWRTCFAVHPDFREEKRGITNFSIDKTEKGYVMPFKEMPLDSVFYLKKGVYIIKSFHHEVNIVLHSNGESKMELCKHGKPLFKGDENGKGVFKSMACKHKATEEMDETCYCDLKQVKDCLLFEKR
jgi:hypothetical protein